MNNPLISVVVITYNSAKTVAETLNSIASQTYKNIQLVISDDGSIDNTVEVCQTWIENNRSQFVDTCLITVEHNTGICANLNRAKKYLKGEWYKGIAGDDILLPHCIEDYLEFVNNNPQAKIVFSYPRVYLNEFKEENLTDKLPYPNEFFNQDAVGQLKKIVYGNFLYAPTKFYHVDVLKGFDYDEQYYFEDWFFNITALKKGYKFYLLDKETIGYRKTAASMQHPQSGQIFYFKMQEAVYKIKHDLCFPYLPIRERIRAVVKFNVERFFEKTGRNSVPYIKSYNRVMAILKKFRLV